MTSSDVNIECSRLQQLYLSRIERPPTTDSKHLSSQTIHKPHSASSNLT